MIYATSTTQLRELATSTCTTAGPSQNCTYTYRQVISTTTQQQSTIELDWKPLQQEESTFYQAMTILSFILVFFIISGAIAQIVEKLTK